jgi:hypothetical protein
MSAMGNEDDKPMKKRQIEKSTGFEFDVASIQADVVDPTLHTIGTCDTEVSPKCVRGQSHREDRKSNPSELTCHEQISTRSPLGLEPVQAMSLASSSLSVSIIISKT